MRPLIVLLFVLAAFATWFVTFYVREDSSPKSLVPSARPQTQPEEGTSGPVELESTVKEREAPTISRVEKEATKRTEQSASQSNELRGLVVDEDNQPVKDAKVILTRFGQANLVFADAGGPDRSQDRTDTTDAKGSYSFRGVTPFDSYSIKVRHPDFGPAEVGQVRVGESGLYEEPRIVLRQGVTLSGYVRDTGGNPVPRAKVYLTLNAFGVIGDEGPDTFAETTDGTGRYIFENVGTGNWTLGIVADGYGRVTVPQVSIVGETEVERDVTLEEAMMIGGRVMDQEGLGIVGATVQAFSLNQRSQQTRSSVESGENGEFVLVDVPEGSYTLLVSKPGYEPWRKQRVESRDMGVAVELVAQPLASGVVRDASSGEPLRRFSVRLRQEVPNSPAAIPVQNTQVDVDDPSGTFTIPVPKPGAYIVEATADAYAMCFSDEFTVIAGQDMAGIDVAMTRGGSISGRVLDADGEPVRNARVTSRDKDWTDDEFTRALGDMMPTLAVTRTVRTDAEGRFTIEGLTPTEYKLEVTHPRHPQETKSGVFVSEGGTAEAGAIRLKRSASVAGNIFDPSGNPVVGAVVTMHTNPGMLASPITYRGKTDAEGRYELQNVSAGSYTVSVRRSSDSGGNPFADWQDAKATERQVTVVEGQRQDGIDFNLGESQD